jgi:type VI secretion system protein ImpL
MAAFLRSRWPLTGIGTLLVAALLWLFGPFWAPLEGVPPRAGLVALLALVWLVLNLLADRRRRRRDDALAAGLIAADPAAGAPAEEVAALRDKLAHALGLLRRASGTRGYLYEQPWYIIIGPPGAGKTTALLNAGLRFPLAEELGGAEVRGVGGTRLCDWVFTEQAVLIDTAGRYTTQDSDATVDRAGWQGFLDLLRRTRPRQPLNGVIVAIALSDVAQGTQDERLAHARAIRRRLKELDERLGMGSGLPVYALFTKADLLAGFVEYFDDLDRERRGQVWGTTFPLAGPPGGPAAAFATELRALVDVLSARVAERLQAERSADRRPAIVGFPAQLASLEAPLTEFLQEAFGGSRLDPAPFLRGVYFTSGTQEGTPIDRMVGALSRSFGIDQRRGLALRPERGRSYFLERLLKNVVFGEAMLAGSNPGARRRRLLLRVAAWGVAGLVLLAGTGALLAAWQANTAAVARFDAAVTAWRRGAEATPLAPVAAADLHRITPLLDGARALPFGPDASDSVFWGLGLGQEDKLRTGAALLYRHALERILLPRLVWRAEQQMRGLMASPARLYEVTRVYLMLGSQGPLDAGLIQDWAAADWARELYPGAAQAPLREDLMRHLRALLAEPLPEVPLDGVLVEDARRVFSTVPVAGRVYSLIRQQAGDHAKPWAPADAGGAGGGRWFTRRSGAPLTEPVPGLFTPAGFWSGVLPALPGAIARVGNETWVLGRAAGFDPANPQALPALERQVIRLYTDDYIRVWSALLDDLDLVAPPTAEQALADLQILSTPQSPLREMLAAIVHNLSLAAPPPVPAAAGAAAQNAALGRFLGADADPPGQAVDDHFRDLREFVERGLDPVLRGLQDLQQQLTQQAAGGPPLPAGDAAARLRALVARSPQPVQRWVTVLAAGGQALRSDLQKRAMLAAYNVGAGGGGGAPMPAPGPLCKALERRYPFVTEGADAPMDDFAKLFGPTGSMDQFFSAQLRPYVAVQGNTWRPQPYMGTEPPVEAADVAVFQRIDRIRQAFFPFGLTPRVTFLVRPAGANSGTRTATLDLGGQPVAWQAGQTPPPHMFEWPGPGGMTSVEVTFDPPATAGARLFETGPWALFRLFARAQRGGGDNQFILTFTQGEREASFEVQTSTNNPFLPALLHNFHCPALGP